MAILEDIIYQSSKQNILFFPPGLQVLQMTGQILWPDLLIQFIKNVNIDTFLF